MLIICISCLYACDLDQVEAPIVDDSVMENEVRALLEGDLFTPSGELKLVEVLPGDIEGNYVIQDWYYDSDRRPTLVIGRFGLDTLGAKLIEYEDNKIRRELDFFHKSGEFTLNSTKYFTYDDQGRLFQILNSQNEPRLTHHYNELGQLQFIRYGKNQDTEADEFIYDEQGRKIKHIFWAGTTPMYEHIFRYDALNRLEAKETNKIGSLERDDVFRYYYNEKDQLVKEEEFYPQLGFQLLHTRIFTYFQDENGNGD